MSLILLWANQHIQPISGCKRQADRWKFAFYASDFKKDIQFDVHTIILIQFDSMSFLSCPEMWLNTVQWLYLGFYL